MKKSNLKPIDIVFAILGSICILIFVIHYSSLYIHAENSYFPMGQNDNDIFTDYDLSQFNTKFDIENYYIFIKFVNYSGTNDRYKNMEILYFPKSDAGFIYAEIFSNGYQFSLYKEGTVNSRAQLWQYDSNNPSLGWYSVRTYQGNGIEYFTSLYSSKYYTSRSYVSNFMVYKNTLREDIVLRYGESQYEPSQGHATENNFDNNDNITNNGHAQQPSTPTFPTFPTITIDTTNIESLLESIFNLVDSFADYVGECFSVFFSWIVLVIQNGFQSVINTIRDFAETFYNNMVTLFEPISQNIEYLVQPISSTIIYDNISSTSLVSNISTIETSLTTFSNSFNNLSEPESYTIPIHLENLSMFGNLSTQYIDLGVINPVKNAIRAFAWALTTYGLFITIVDSIANYINGGQDE